MSEYGPGRARYDRAQSLLHEDRTRFSLQIPSFCSTAKLVIFPRDKDIGLNIPYVAWKTATLQAELTNLCTICRTESLGVSKCAGQFHQKEVSSKKFIDLLMKLKGDCRYFLSSICFLTFIFFISSIFLRSTASEMTFLSLASYCSKLIYQHQPNQSLDILSAIRNIFAKYLRNHQYQLDWPGYQCG